MASTETSETQHTLAQWLAREASVQATLDSGIGCAAVPRAQALAMDGLALMHAMLEGRAPFPPIGQTLGFTLIEVDAGHAVFQGTPGAGHLNPLCTVHGGWYATLLDSAMGCAIHTRMPAGRAYTTAELSVNLVRAMLPGKPVRVRAEGQVIHCGRQLATAEARLVGPDGTLYAHGTTTCLVFDAPA